MKTTLRILILAGICAITLASTPIPTQTPADGPFPPPCLPKTNCG